MFDILERRRKSKSGFSVIEVLIIVALLAVLMTALFRFMSPQLAKSRDAKRKSDLDKFKLAFEDYYNDNQCYPDADVLDTCYSDALRPYIHSVPCDPHTGQPYAYIPATNQCKGYRLLTALENKKDPAISQLDCVVGCGGIPPANAAYENRNDYVYGVSVGQPVSIYGSLDTGYACPSPGGSCTPCQIAGGECSLYPLAYPSMSECEADPDGCG